MRGDIGDRGLVEKLFGENGPPAIVNFAADSHVDRSIHGPKDFIKANVLGTFELLGAARTYWNGLEGAERNGFRFLHVSTDHVKSLLELSVGPIC